MTAKNGEVMKGKKAQSSLLSELEELESVIARFDDTQISALKAFIISGKSTLSFFSGQPNRLKKKLGENHPRVRELKSRLKRNSDLIKELEAELELARIEVPDIPECSALVHGRIVDKSNHGIPELSVSAEDERDEPLRPFGNSETNVSGYFSIPLSRKTLSFLSKRKYYLSVRAYLGELVHREPKALKVSENSVAQVSIILECVGWRTSRQ